MSDRLFKMSFVITGLRFQDGHSYPCRIEIGGKILYPEVTSTGNQVSFYQDGKHYWLERRGRTWRWLRV